MRFALLRAGLRRKEGYFLLAYPALTPSARKRASGHAGQTCGRAYGATDIPTAEGGCAPRFRKGTLSYFAIEFEANKR